MSFKTNSETSETIAAELAGSLQDVSPTLLLDQLAERAGSLQELLAGLLGEMMPASGATAGVIWLADSNGNLRPSFHDRWHALGIASSPEGAQKHRQLITLTAQKRQVQIVGPHNKGVDELPLPQVFAMTPLLRQNQLLGLVELVLPPIMTESQLSQLLVLLEHVCGLVATYQQEAQEKFQPLQTLAFWQAAEPLLFEWYQYLDSKKLAYMAAIHIKDRLAVDRVTIFTKIGRQPKVIAVSGQSKVSRHSPLIKQLRSLTRKVLKTGEPFLHSSHQQVMHPGLQQPLSDYLTESGSQMLAIYPLWSVPEKDAHPDEPNQRRRNRRQIGAVVVERSRSARFENAREEVFGLLADHLGNALQRAQQHEAIFLLPLWRAIGQSVRWFYRHKFWQSLATLLLITAFLTSLIVIPWDYRVTGQGALMPVVQKQVFAPWDAEVAEVHISGGEVVTAGTTLVTLVSKDLEAEEIRLRTLIGEKQTSLRALRSAREASLQANNREDAIEIEGRYAEHQVEIRHLIEQHQLVQSRLADLVVKAPIDGVVATFQVDQLLEDRPVNRGDLLLEVMDPNSEWHLELKLEDRRMGHLLAARQKNPDLPVEYILVTDPEVSFFGSLKQVGLRANTDPDAGNVVDIQVKLDSAQDPAKAAETPETSETALNQPVQNAGATTSAAPPLRIGATTSAAPPLRIGAEVKAKISCGPKPLGYVLFGDVIDYLRKQLWL